MFCVNCGKELPEGSKFCSTCGEKQPVTEEIMPEQPAVEELQPEQPAAEGVQPETEILQSEAPVAEAPVAVQVPEETVPEPENGKKKKKEKKLKEKSGKKSGGKVILIIAIALVVLAALAVGVYLLFFYGDSDAGYIYWSDGKYGIVTNLKKGETQDFANSRMDTAMYNGGQFSPDGKYFYYITKYDYLHGTGTLCRAEFAKLRADSDRNDNYIETVASDVWGGFEILEDGSVIYKNAENELYHFDGEEEVLIGKKVGYQFFSDGVGRVIYLSGKAGEGTLYAVDLNDPDDRVKLDSGVFNIQNIKDFNNILYTKTEEDGSTLLYLAGFDKEPELLGRNVIFLGGTEEKTYFAVEGEDTLCLYDYVNDPDAAEDLAAVEPNIDDYAEPVYKYVMLTGNDLSEADYTELYTSCNKDLYWYNRSYWWNYSMDESLDKDWGDNTDAIHEATLGFINTYSKTCDKYGYIKVNDKVKEALQEIAQYGDNAEDWQWLWLCYNKTQTGYTTNYTEYETAMMAWYEVDERNSLREALKDPQNGCRLKTLYCLENGVLTVVSENVLNAQMENGAVAYKTVDMADPVMDLRDIYDPGQVAYLLCSISWDEAKHVVMQDGTICQLSDGAFVAYDEAQQYGYRQLFYTPSTVYLSQGDGQLFAASVSGGTVGTFELIAEDAPVMKFVDGTLYYASNVSYEDIIPYGDVYACTDGVSTRLLEDIILKDIYIYEDGVVLACTDYDASAGYEKSMLLPDGKEVRLGDRVFLCYRVDESTVIYISDGDLYTHDGKEKTRLKKDVEHIWCLNTMQHEVYLTWNDDTYFEHYQNAASAVTGATEYAQAEEAASAGASGY